MNSEIGDLIFIRHGKENIKENSDGEIKRVLKKAGHADLKKIMPYLKSHIREGVTPYLLASPEFLQTAEIIVSEMENVEASDCECIATGDLNDFQDKVLHLEQPFCIILVGDEPCLGDWSKEIGGSMLSYKRGMAVGFEVSSLQPLKAQPQWIIQPDALNLDDFNISKENPALNEYKKILFFHLQAVFDMQNEFINAPDDPETTHQLRVKIRTLRSLLSFIKPLISEEEYAHTQDSLRELGRNLGHLREIDVLTEEWNKLLENHTEIAEKSKKLSEILNEERSQELEKVQKYVQEGKPAAVLFDVYNWIYKKMDAPHRQLDKDNPTVSFEEFTKERYKSLCKRAEENFKKTDFSNLESIHSMRIQYKKLRYALSSISPFLHLPTQVDIGELKSLQDRLGIVCDSHRNSALLNDLNKKYNSPELLHESGILAGYQLRLADEQISRLAKMSK